MKKLLLERRIHENHIKKYGPIDKSGDDARIATKLKIEWSILLGRNPPPASIQFTIYGWLVQKAQDEWVVRKAPGSPLAREALHGPFDALSGSSSIGRWKALPFTWEWEKELKKRWEALILCPLHCDDGPLCAWKKKNKIGWGLNRIIPIRYPSNPNYWSTTPGPGDIEAILGGILATTGTLKKSHNECHPGAKSVYGITLGHNGSKFEFDINYGFPDSGGWRLVAARQEAMETFHDFVLRASKSIDDLISGDGFAEIDKQLGEAKK
jgi:hypothetical protein